MRHGQTHSRGRRFALSSLTAVVLLPFVTVCAAAQHSEAVDKTGNLVAVYGVTALLAVLLAVVCAQQKKKYEIKFLLLACCVAAADCGYFLLSVSRSLPMALAANALSYLGGAYAVLLVLLILLDACRAPQSRGLRGTLTAITTAAFLLAASGRWLGLYYTDVTLENIYGMTRLLKVYGPLHFLYRVYLLSYLALMVGAILWAIIRKKNASVLYAAFLAAIVVGNLCVWFVEQRMYVGFEFLSVSYILTELLLALFYSLLRQNGILLPTALHTAAETLPPEMDALLADFVRRCQELTTAERRILGFYIDGFEPDHIAQRDHISIHTVKKHNHSIYQKLGVSSRDELRLYIELFRRCGRLDTLRL